MHWFREGDQNSRYFQSYEKGRRKRLDIQKIEDNQGKMMELSLEIRDEAVKFSKPNLQRILTTPDFDTLNLIPRVLIDEDRMEMERWPKEAEIREVVFGLNKDTASGLGGFSGDFYQSC